MEAAFEDCYVRAAEDGRMEIGNGRIARVIDLSTGRPLSVSLRNEGNGDEWVGGGRRPLFDVPWLPAEADGMFVRALVDDDCGIAAPHLRAELTMLYERKRVALRVVFRVYPGAAVLRQELQAKRLAPGEAPLGERLRIGRREAALATVGGMRLDANNPEAGVVAERRESIDGYALRELHCRWRSVSLRDRTDTNNNLTSEEDGLLYPNERRSLRGNLLFLEKNLSPGGLLIVKESPTALAQLRDAGEDFRFEGTYLTVVGGGAAEEDLEEDRYLSFYGTAVGAYDGSEYERLRLMRTYHDKLRVPRPERDVFLMSNTWGDRSRDGRVNEAFIVREIDEARALGITHVQIDDGWQKGATSNSVAPGGRWGDYYSQDDGFWDVHPERFPRGLEPVVRRARESGVELGLWFSPDGSDEFRHWRRDAEQLIRLYDRFAVRYFKLDGIRLTSKAAEENLVGMMQAVVRHSGGDVYFNLDTTSEVRLGYFGRVQYGGLFLENRYTDWSNYYPHWTFRNLWKLSAYFPAQRLQMEFLNVRRNREAYDKSDPLAPSRCGIGYAFLIVAFSNPLAWMELSSLPEDDAARLEACIRRIRPLHRDIVSGLIAPIGEEPTGTSWSGLQSIANDGGGFLLVVREYNDAPKGRFRLRDAKGRKLRLSTVCVVEGGEPTAADDAEEALVEPGPAGDYVIRLGRPLSAAVYRYAWT